MSLAAAEQVELWSSDGTPSEEQTQPALVWTQIDPALSLKKGCSGCRFYAPTNTSVSSGLCVHASLWEKPSADFYAGAVCAKTFRYERKMQKRGEDAEREGERGVLRAGQTAASPGGHHLPAGQGLHHPADQQLPQDESSLPRR